MAGIPISSLVFDDNAVYFISDTREIFVGNQRYAYDLKINIVGTGNAIVGAELDATGTTLTLTKGAGGGGAIWTVREST